jgi:Mg-chelatase subunit ChlD
MELRAPPGRAGDHPPGSSSLPDAEAVSLARRAAAPLTGRRVRLAGTVYLLLDLSASMADEGKMPELLRGAVRFFYEAWRRHYAVGVIGFARGARVLTGATRNPHRFQRSLAGLSPGGGTDMAAALGLACARLRGRAGHRVALLITDGMPDDRRATLDAAARARALGLTLVAVGTGRADEAFLRALGPQPELAAVVDLEHFADGIGRVAGSLAGG